MLHFDSHVLVWMYLPRRDLFSKGAIAAIAHAGAGELGVSPMAVLELTYLKEVGRLTVDGPTIVSALADEIGLVIDPTPFAKAVERAHALTWTRDPFDRLIVAHALVAGATLFTADQTILDNVPTALW